MRFVPRVLLGLLLVAAVASAGRAAPVTHLVATAAHVTQPSTADPCESPSPDPSESPEASPSPHPSESPEASPSPDPSASPAASPPPPPPASPPPRPGPSPD